MAQKLSKDFKETLDRLPLKPTLKQMQAAVDEHQERIEEICDEVREERKSKGLDPRYLEEFVEEQNDRIRKREARLDKNETLTITVCVRGCEDCRHIDHSGAFTPGGAKMICGHPDISENILKHKPHTRNDDPNALSNNKKHDNHIDKQCYYWRNRIVEKYIEKGTIPYFCPLKNGSAY